MHDALTDLHDRSMILYKCRSGFDIFVMFSVTVNDSVCLWRYHTIAYKRNVRVAYEHS